jgi:hypothetical protein
MKAFFRPSTGSGPTIVIPVAEGSSATLDGYWGGIVRTLREHFPTLVVLQPRGRVLFGQAPRGPALTPRLRLVNPELS